MRIKPIETVYNGYRFRSRLEARWAVFFDALDLKYEYEPEGWDLGDEWYLPDFYLPDWNWWIEVKPKLPTFDEFLKVLKLRHGLIENNPREDRIVREHCSILAGYPGVPYIELKPNGNWKSRSGYVILDPLAFDPATKVSNSQTHFSSVQMAQLRQIGIDPLEIVCHVQVFAMVDGGTALDIWPLYICESMDKAIHSFYAKLYRNLDLDYKVFWVPSFPAGYSIHSYVGSGIDYESQNLTNAYRVARQARF